MKKINNIETLGKLILDTRKAQDLTQEQLAASAGVGVRFVRELEHGKESCYVGKTLAVLNMLGLEVVLADRREVREWQNS